MTSSIKDKTSIIDFHFSFIAIPPEKIYFMGKKAGKTGFLVDEDALKMYNIVCVCTFVHAIVSLKKLYFQNIYNQVNGSDIQ